jgi:hypothetical protein
VLCPYCDAANTRCGVLALELRKVIIELHKTLKHQSEFWDTCRENPCQRVHERFRHAGLPVKRL